MCTNSGQKMKDPKSLRRESKAELRDLGIGCRYFRSTVSPRTPATVQSEEDLAFKCYFNFLKSNSYMAFHGVLSPPLLISHTYYALSYGQDQMYPVLHNLKKRRINMKIMNWQFTGDSQRTKSFTILFDIPQFTDCTSFVVASSFGPSTHPSSTAK